MQLIGREQEQNTILAALEGLAAGHGALLLLCGEAGIGKSSLARWAGETGQRSGLGTHWGICWEAGGAPAYWPWTQLLRSLLATDESGETAALLRASPALLQLLPEFAEVGTTPVTMRADQARFQLLESVRTLLHRASATRPLLLLLEDLHTADTDTLLLLQYLAPHLSTLPICVLGTFRDADARLSGSAEPLWQAARGATVMHLPGLVESQIDALLQQLTGTEGSPELLHALLERTDGNPFFLTELIQLRSSSTEGSVPDSVHQAIRQHMQRLPAATCKLLESAAVMGRAFVLDELRAVAVEIGADLEADLEPARKLDIVQRFGEEQFRFSHILYRDAIHGDLDPHRKRELHQRYARSLQQAIESGQDHRWQELATHLERAGPGQRAACVQAWRRAGDYARQLSAFEDAVACQKRALALFGEGPKADPWERCGLLLDVAEVEMARGDVEAAFDHCRDAFRIARSLGDSGFMARAALVFGSAFVATNIDDELVGMLEEALSVLPLTATAERAQVSARLAAALQPAEDPTVPIEMAREAIALARECTDDQVLLNTLRSAISALMDFAPAAERFELNREYIALAEGAQNLAEQFRGQLRLMIDCVELGQGRGFASAIKACDAIATALGLPHYQWRVASSKAFRAIVQGEFSDAAGFLEEAEKLAQRSEDRGADLALALQRMDLLEAAGELDRIEEGVRAVEGVLREYPWAAVLVRPYLLNVRHRHALPVIDAQEIDEASIDRVLRWGDRMSIGDLAELAIFRGDRELCEQVYQALLPHADQCAHWGLMGMGWCGPVAFNLALCARFLGRMDEARTHLEVARTLAEQMRARPVLDSIRNLEKTLESGPAPASAGQSGSMKGQDLLHLSRDGEMWRVSFDDASVLMKDSRGLQILSQLLASPDREIHVLDLVGASAVDGQEEAGGDPGLDDQARQAYKQRLRELEEELQEAEEFDDIGRSEQAREEMEFIARELSRAFGLGGRARKSGTAAERARVNVRRRLKDAIQRIGEQLPDAGRYLEGTIDTGTYCRYRPF